VVANVAARSAVNLARSPRSERQWRRIQRSLRRHPTGLVGAAIILLLVLTAVFAPLVAPYDPLDAAFRARLVSPSPAHPFGTDNLGRDILSRVIFGTRLSLWAGVVAVAISLVGGTIVGIVSGYYRGPIDAMLMALTDLFLALPGILVSMVFIFSFGPSLTNVALAVGLASIPYYARIARGSVLSAREQVYVEAARVLGASDRSIMFRHVLPNVIAPILVVATLGLGSTILIIASLSFLGLGAQPPSSEWGAIVSDGRTRIATAWWISTFGGIAIMLTVLGVNLLGDALRDALDPRLRQR
jgi:peptide/nickel transport system permease protein